MARSKPREKLWLHSKNYVIIFLWEGCNRREKWERKRSAIARIKELQKRGAQDIHFYEAVHHEIELIYD